MNVSRNIPSAFWSDEKVAEFNTEDKLFFLYLLTNANTKQVGVYKVSPRQMSFDSGLSPEAIETLMKRFEDEYGLIQYDSSSREICILNWGKFNFKKGGKPVEDLIKKELRDVTRLDFAEIVARKIPSEKVRTAVLNAIENELTNRGTNRHTNREEVAITTETTNRHTNRGTNRESIGETPFEEPQKDEETLIQSDFTNRGTNRHTNRETVKSEERISEDLTNRGTNRHTNRKEEEKKNTGRKSHNTKRLQTIKNEALEMTDEVFELLELWRAKRGTASDYILDQVKDSIQIYGVEKVREVMERMAAPIHFMVFEEELEK